MQIFQKFPELTISQLGTMYSGMLYKLRLGVVNRTWHDRNKTLFWDALIVVRWRNLVRDKRPALDRVWPYKTRFFVHIHCRKSWILRHSCMYTRKRGDHAQIQDYNDSTHYRGTTNYAFTHVSLVWNVAHMRLFSSRAHEFLKWQKFLLKPNSLFRKICI